ncbi:MAG: hypothetical protein ABI600_02475 [Luteolibacter sp.]
MKMHLLPSQNTVTRFKLVSWVLFFIYLMIPSTFGVIAYSVAVEDHEFMQVALALIVATVVAVIIHWSISARARCPICHSTALSRSGCTKHRNARTFFGSYRFRVACSVIFRKCFCCPYCGESTTIKARPRPLPRPKYH